MIQVLMLHFNLTLLYLLKTSTAVCLLTSQTKKLTKVILGPHLQIQPMITPPTSTTRKVVNTLKLVGDNVDSMFKQRYMRSDKHKAGGIHYFHTYAACDRIDFSLLSERFPEPNSLPRAEDVALSLLPSNKDDKAIGKHFEESSGQSKGSLDQKGGSRR